MILIILCSPLYLAISFMVFFYHINDIRNSDGYAARHAIFWPLYLIHWVVRSFILAIRGL